MPTRVTPNLFLVKYEAFIINYSYIRYYNYNYCAKVFILTIKGGHDGTWSMSHMITLWMVLCLRTSLAADPSPPPIINTALGLQLLNKRKKKDIIIQQFFFFSFFT